MIRRTQFHDFFNPENPLEEVDIRVDNLPHYWPVKKVLTRRDIDAQLVLPKAQAEEYILPHLLPEDQSSVNRCHYLPITMIDDDTQTECQLKLWKNASNSYVLTQGWKNRFVSRRELEVGEEVGFGWAQGSQELHFTVLSRQSSALHFSLIQGEKAIFSQIYGEKPFVGLMALFPTSTKALSRDWSDGYEVERLWRR
ncbi:hypothetical protein NE237_013067 [Protea cynaroides]|uniref:TF-B3 domain-containing protein n=1 Tax=Protea cynaroides TaxID=273540 RepID=A0A9Q0JXG9_9MAGN|nr:hypothetical protein NE237_013067 [Protea cynaroides]